MSKAALAAAMLTLLGSIDGGVAGDGKRIDMAGITGTWRVEAASCSQRMPSRLVFDPNGTFAAPEPDDAGAYHDAGSWRIEDGELFLSTAADEIVSYRLSELDEARAVLERGDGCRLVLTRR